MNLNLNPELKNDKCPLCPVPLSRGLLVAIGNRPLAHYFCAYRLGMNIQRRG